MTSNMTKIEGRNGMLSYGRGMEMEVIFLVALIKIV